MEIWVSGVGQPAVQKQARVRGSRWGASRPLSCTIAFMSASRSTGRDVPLHVPFATRQGSLHAFCGNWTWLGHCRHPQAQMHQQAPSLLAPP